MQKTDWNAHLDYLRESRKRWFHPDYLEFLVRKVWCIDKPIRVADFACGLGYLGSALMPFLPKGSTYTGFDNAETLLNEALFPLVGKCKTIFYGGVINENSSFSWWVKSRKRCFTIVSCLNIKRSY